jgi:hypothetical protein
MYKVTTIEFHRGAKVVTMYDFENVAQCNTFVKLCKEAGIQVVVNNIQRSA